ncbi:22737_t:CDS:1, partial [Dentiscutata erythropus]
YDGCSEYELEELQNSEQDYDYYSEHELGYDSQNSELDYNSQDSELDYDSQNSDSQNSEPYFNLL